MLLRLAACVLLPFIALCADNLDDLKQRADQARAAHDIPAACDLYGRAVALDPNWIEGWWYLGNMLFVAGRYPAAEAALQHFTDARPDLAEAWAMRGMAAVQAQSYEQAAEYIHRSLSLSFTTIPALQPVALTNYAFLLSRIGRYDDGLRALRSFVHGTPDAELLNALGIAALHRRLMPADIAPSDRPLMEAAGGVELQLMTGDPGAAKSAADLTEQYPSALGVHYLAGMVYFASDVNRAQAEFAREFQLNPHDVAAESMLAYTKFALHQVSPDALKMAADAVASDPGNASYQYVFGVMSDSTGDVPGAVSALEKANQLMPNEVEYHVALATVYGKAGQFDKALSERQRALTLKFGHGS